MSVLRGEAARRVLDRVSYNRRHAATTPSRVGRSASGHRPADALPFLASEHASLNAAATALSPPAPRPAEPVNA
jgi:ApbE superfamily uncharacterized protein (UPF0280 family)